MTDREKLVKLIGGTKYGIENRSTIKVNFQRGFIEKIADHLIAHGVTVQGWIPVDDERKPKDRNNYFIAYVFGDSDMHFFGEAKYHAYEGNGIIDRSHFSNEGVNGMRVTHWMEIPKLPKPPKEGDGHA